MGSGLGLGLGLGFGLEPRKAPAAAPTGPATIAPAAKPIWPAPRPRATLSFVSEGRQVRGSQPLHARCASLPLGLSRSARWTEAAPC